MAIWHETHEIHETHNDTQASKLALSLWLYEFQLHISSISWNQKNCFSQKEQTLSKSNL